MRKSNFKILALTAALIMPLSSCKETIIYVTPEDTPNDDIKTPIELSVGGVEDESVSITRAAEKTEGKTYNSFDKKAKVFILMQSDEEIDSNGDVVSHGGFEYKGNRPATLYTVARGDVSANSSDLVFDENNKKYWDDAHARSSQLTMWAIAQKVAEDQVDGNWKSITFRTYGATDDNTKPSIGESSNATYNTNKEIAWQGTTPIYPAIYSWSVGNPGANQNLNTLIYQDLLFSNNISYNKEKNWSDSRLKFDFTTKKFPATNELKFHHAMSKITICLKAGDGFIADGTDFSLKNNTVDKLHGFNTQGLFNIKDGEFQMIHKSDDITMIPLTKTETGKTNSYYTLEALAIPNIHDFMLSKRTTERPGLKDDNSRFVSGGTNTMMEFTIDNNTFKITSDALYKALKGKTGTTEKTDNGTYIPLEAGKNYIFTFVVGKTKITNITATIANWEDVKADDVTPKINIDKTYGHDGTAFAQDFDFFRSTTKTGGYSKDAYVTHAESTSGTHTYTFHDQLYWPDHQTHYFFRGVYPRVQTASNETGWIPAEKLSTSTSSASTIAVENTTYTANTYPSDLAFGWTRTGGDANDDETCKVHTSTQGICATEGKINLNFRYVMSQVEVILKTNTATGATDKVNLTNAKVEVINGCKAGTIKLEDGSVGSTTTGDFGITMAAVNGETKGNSSVIPQSLVNGSNNLRFKITIYKEGSTTEIDDIYYADIKDINVTEGTSTTSKAITSWEAGKHYIYFLELKKTEIKVSATITDWVTATGSTNVWF